MTQGVILHLSHMFGTKWGRIEVAGGSQDCFFNRESLLNRADFDVLGSGYTVEFDVMIVGGRNNAASGT